LRGRWWDFVNKTTIFQALENAGNFLESRTNCKILEHGSASWCACGRPEESDTLPRQVGLTHEFASLLHHCTILSLYIYWIPFNPIDHPLTHQISEIEADWSHQSSTNVRQASIALVSPCSQQPKFKPNTQTTCCCADVTR